MTRIYGHAYGLLDSIREHEKVSERTGKNLRKIVRVEADPHTHLPPDPHAAEAITAGCIEVEVVPSGKYTDLAYATLTEVGRAELAKGHPGIDGREVSTCSICGMDLSDPDPCTHPRCPQ